ncbi:hypothetical protein Q7306_05010 [Glaesserella parasuis]|uniref:Phage protein n=3 Tax=Glaesserella parasuis TaxID=738 RepID=A0A836YY95_GLAPU|nr:hypothetical protein [Glaesserella parasuis]YP_007002948.1 tail assembly chaperone [Haemophilus phage SuMu]AEG42282.1 hypothetical protein SuMu_40 [Haemophilus phage SuMu]ATW46332.1 hypothetical protein A2U21_10580 [Glaesserella parasuis str. Nagasaki]AWY46444.1 hypothetical protein B4U42_11140 [Glaesserella parasuis 29755]EPZ99629.1 hypothetical protein HPSNAG_1961 [Glaesserella parasuis str. Nagasaki]EQA94860.1 hypothetical protein HPS_1644 [Glaesserella parasuis 29755]
MKVELLGFEYQGKVFKQANVRLLTMGGQCTALEMIDAMGIDEENASHKEAILVDMAYLSQQVSFDGIPAEIVDAQFLFEHLATDDYWQLLEATLMLKKKPIGNGASLDNLSNRQDGLA